MVLYLHPLSNSHIFLTIINCNSNIHDRTEINAIQRSSITVGVRIYALLTSFRCIIYLFKCQVQFENCYIIFTFSLMSL